jgi:branched-chain amino acid transport system substrate-binding protein
MPRHGRAAPAAALLLAALLLAAGACSVPGQGNAAGGSRPTAGHTPGPTGPAVRVGVVTDLTGPESALGDEQRRGAELAAKEVAGRAGNHRLLVLVRDGQGKPDAALAAARDLVRTERVDFLTGCVSAASGQAVNQAAKEAGIPYVGTCASGQLDRPPDLGPSTFSLAPRPDQLVIAITPWVVQNLGKRVLFLEPQLPEAHQQYEAFQRAAPGAGALDEGVIWVPPDTTDFTSHLPKIKAAPIDVLVLGLGGRERASFLKQAHQFGLDPQVKTFQLGVDAALDDQVGFDAVAGTYGVTSFAWTGPDAGGQRFAGDYQAAYGRPPGEAAAAAHDAVSLVAQQVAAERFRAADFTQAVSGQPVDLSGGQGFVRACDHQAFLPTYVVQGLAQAEAASKGGSARYGYRAVVATIPADEHQAPSCADLGLH